MLRYSGMNTWVVVIRDTRDAQTDEPLSEAAFKTSVQLRAFLDSYMLQHAEFVSEYWIYRNGEEHEHVSN